MNPSEPTKVQCVIVSSSFVLYFLSVLAVRNVWFLCTLWLSVSLALCVCCRGHDPAAHSHMWHQPGGRMPEHCSTSKTTSRHVQTNTAMTQHDVHVSGGRILESSGGDWELLVN